MIDTSELEKKVIQILKDHQDAHHNYYKFREYVSNDSYKPDYDGLSNHGVFSRLYATEHEAVRTTLRKLEEEKKVIEMHNCNYTTNVEERIP